MTPSLGIEPRPHWCEASALTTAPSLGKILRFFALLLLLLFLLFEDLSESRVVVVYGMTLLKRKFVEDTTNMFTMVKDSRELLKKRN